jgi:hypothetical protein
MARSVAEKSRTSPVDGERPTLGGCGSCDGESAHTEERIHADKEQNVRPHAKGLETWTRKLILERA